MASRRPSALAMVPPVEAAAGLPSRFVTRPIAGRVGEETGASWLPHPDRWSSETPRLWQQPSPASTAGLGLGLAGAALGAWRSRRPSRRCRRRGWPLPRGLAVVVRAAAPPERSRAAVAATAGHGGEPWEEDERPTTISSVDAMVEELRALGTARGEGGDEGSIYELSPDEASGMGAKAADVSALERSGEVCVIGVPNAGKSSFVNAMVGTKVSIVSPKPQTTRQRVLGLALLAPRPHEPPNTQAVFVDTAGIIVLANERQEQTGPYRKKKGKRLFKNTKLHKAMVKTAWRSARYVDAIFWVLDAQKLHACGDYMPEQATIDGFAIGPVVEDSWWLHPELEEELAILRKFRNFGRRINVILNKMDLVEEVPGVDLNSFVLTIRQRLEEDLGETEDGQGMLMNLWPTSVLKAPDTLNPIKLWLCENLPEQSPIYPVSAVSDVPARVVASEITREKLFRQLLREVPYQTAVLTVVWRERDDTADGLLMLGQRVVVQNHSQARIVRSVLRKITSDAEEEISKTLNFGNPVRLHFQVLVEPKWQDNMEYYDDLQGLLSQDGSLLYPVK